MMTATRSKAAWRQWARQQMESLSPHDVERLSELVRGNVTSIEEFAMARHVLTCLSFGREVNTWPMVDEMIKRSSRFVYVPRMDADGVMHIHPFPCRLQTLRMGLRQPLPTEPEVPPDAVPEIIDVAIVLGLAFERSRGYRLGHGKGYFDRFLSDKHIFAIGLSFEQVMVDRLPAEDHDVPMQVVVSEERVYRF